MPIFCSSISLHLVVMSPSVLLGCDSFSDFPCFWWPSQFSWVLVRYFVECPSGGIHLMFSLILGWDYGFGGGSPQKCSAIFITSSQGYKSLLLFVTFFIKLLFSPLSMLCSLEESVCSSHLKNGKLCFTFLSTKYLCKLFGIPLHRRFVCSPLFVYYIILLV